MSKKKKKKKFKKHHHFVHQSSTPSELSQTQGSTIHHDELGVVSTRAKKELASKSTWEPPTYIRSDLRRIGIWTISLVILLFFVYYFFVYTDLFRPILDWIKV